MKDSKISIITVTYNAAAVLEETILSVINQTYFNVEYIIIDGGSTDGTIDLIKKYEDKISCWLSEPDKGIYDAMNKGIDKASGEWINFMNAGDIFCKEDVLYNVFDGKSYSSEIIYGSAYYKSQYGSVITYPLDLVKINDIMAFCHQSSFVKLNVIREYYFDLKYKIAGDYNFFYNAYKDNRVFEYVPIPISVYEAENGISATQYLKALKEERLIRNEKFWAPKSLRRILKVRTILFLKKIMPSNCILYMKKVNNKVRSTNSSNKNREVV